MRKENILVVVLLALALGGVYMYNRPGPDLVVAADITPSATLQTALADTSREIIWNDYTPGMALAQKDKKSVFLYFHASWCGYCVKLKNNTFKDDRVKSYLNTHFISISVDTDQRKNLAREYQVRGLPTLWFLEPDGTKINNLPGYVDADQLLPILEYIHTQSYKTMKFQDFVKQKKS